MGAENVKNVNKNNALQAVRSPGLLSAATPAEAPRARQVLFEAVGLVILLERDRDLVEMMAVQLGRFIAAKEPNTRWVAARAWMHTVARGADSRVTGTWGWRTWGGYQCCRRWLPL